MIRIERGPMIDDLSLVGLPFNFIWNNNGDSVQLGSEKKTVFKKTALH